MPSTDRPRRWLSLFAAVLLAGPLSGQARPGPDMVAARQPIPSQPWAHVSSDVPADPDLRTGTLPNGMRYALLRNATPPGQASLRLRIDAGSLMEQDDQRGLAHFMEHMAFNGTTNIQKTRLNRILERLGLAYPVRPSAMADPVNGNTRA